MQNLLENVYDKTICLSLIKCFIHLIKTIITTQGLQITTYLISYQHELHTMEHTSLERRQQKHGMKSKE